MEQNVFEVKKKHFNIEISYFDKGINLLGIWRNDISVEPILFGIDQNNSGIVLYHFVI